MNKIFRVIWNATTQRFVVASELAKGKVKSQSSNNAMGSAARKTVALSGLAMAVAIALPASNVFAAAIIANGATLNYDGQDIVSTANNSESGRGLSASNNGSITFTNGSLTTSGTAGVGAMANTGATITLKNTNNKTTGSSAQGLLSQNNSNIDADGVSITASGSASYGIHALNGSATLSNGSISSVAYGAVAQGATGNITLNNTTVNTSGEKGHAAYATKGGQVTVNNSTLAATGHLAAGALAIGAGSQININNSDISTAGSSAEAVYAQNGGVINLTNTKIFTDRINSYGLRASGGNTLIDFDGGTITTTGGTTTIQSISGAKINVRNATINSSSDTVKTYDNGTLNLDNVIINNDGLMATRAAGIFAAGAGTNLNAKNVQVKTTGGNVLGIQVGSANATLDNVEINSALRGDGLQAYGGANIVANNVRMNIESQDGLEISSGLSMGSYAGDNNVEMVNSQINMQGANSAALVFKSTEVSNNTLSLANSVVTASEGTAMKVTDTANAEVTTSGTLLSGATLLSAGVGNSGTVSNVELTGDNGSVFNGDVIIDRANTAKNIINLDNNSAWNGATSSLENLNLANGSQWNVTSSSAVDNLTLNNATLNMTAPGTGFSRVTLSSLNSTNGTIDFKRI